MSTTLENLTEELTVAINDTVTLNLIDQGYSPAEALEAGKAQFDFIAELELYGADPLDLDPIFFNFNADNVLLDTLQF